jgi:5-hydroxyisourate hydrolase-like protein (transthyretin family)
MKTLVAIVPLLFAACSDDPVSFSAPVGINLKVKSGDVANTAISEDKAITTETGNPYSAFVSDATTKLGHAPGRIEIDRVTLQLGAQSTNVTRLEDVFTGVVDVSFLMNDTNNTYEVGTLTSPGGVGPDDVAISLAGGDMAPQDFTKYLVGSFKVVARGTAAPGFASNGAEASLQLTFTFAAFN